MKDTSFTSLDVISTGVSLGLQPHVIISEAHLTGYNLHVSMAWLSTTLNGMLNNRRKAWICRYRIFSRKIHNWHQNSETTRELWQTSMARTHMHNDFAAPDTRPTMSGWKSACDTYWPIFLSTRSDTLSLSKATKVLMKFPSPKEEDEGEPRNEYVGMHTHTLRVHVNHVNLAEWDWGNGTCNLWERNQLNNITFNF